MVVAYIPRQRSRSLEQQQQDDEIILAFLNNYYNDEQEVPKRRKRRDDAWGHGDDLETPITATVHLISEDDFILVTEDGINLIAESAA